MSTPPTLEALAAGARKAAPVDLWDPPYCGDIGLAIAANGEWSYQGSPILRRPMVHLFASVLRKDADGETYLVTPAEKVRIRVADAPFLGVELTPCGHERDQVVRLRTNLDDEVAISSSHPLRIATAPDGGMKTYVLIRGRLEALLTRSATLDLVAIAEASTAPGRPLGLWSSGDWWPLET